MLPSLLLPLLGGCSGPWGRRPASPGLIGSGEHQRDPALSGDGRVLATVRDGRGAARVLLQEQPGGRILPLRHLGGQRPQRSPALSWRGRYLAAIVQQGPRRVVLIEDRLSGRPLRLPLPTGDEPQQLSLAPDGQRLAVELWREGQPRVELYDLSGLLERDLPPGLRLPQAPGGTP